MALINLDFKTTSPCPEMATRPSLEASFLELGKGLLYHKPKNENERFVNALLAFTGKMVDVERYKPNASSSTQSHNLDMFVQSRIFSQVNALRSTFLINERE